jgi:DNA-binding FrmR family transcriptional regulator
VAIGLLDEHMHHCVTEAAKHSDPLESSAAVTEATRAIERLIRS